VGKFKSSEMRSAVIARNVEERFVEHPTLGLIDIRPTTTFTFKPTVHLTTGIRFYQ
jgi:hypothetical protein